MYLFVLCYNIHSISWFTKYNQYLGIPVSLGFCAPELLSTFLKLPSPKQSMVTFSEFLSFISCLKLPLCLSFYLYVDSESQSPTKRTFDSIIMYSVESYEPYEIPYIQSAFTSQKCGNFLWFSQIFLLEKHLHKDKNVFLGHWIFAVLLRIF